MRYSAGLLLIGLLSGCAFNLGGGAVVNRGGVRAGVWVDSEVRWVVYGEYFGCTEAEILSLRLYPRYYAVDLDDLFFITFTARRARVSIDVAFDAFWRICARDHHRFVLHFGLKPDIYFAPVPTHVSCPPPYGRAYGYWRKRSLSGVRLSAGDYRALVEMKIGCDYYGFGPEAFFNRCRTLGKPGKVLVTDYKFCGRGKSWKGGRVVARGPKPWQMDGASLNRWRGRVKDKERRHDVKFKGKHGKAKGKPAPKPKARPAPKPKPAPKAKSAPKPAPKPKGKPEEEKGGGKKGKSKGKGKGR